MGTSGGFVSGHRLRDVISSQKSIARSKAGIWPCLSVRLLALLFSTYALADSGAVIYREHCAACHGSNGSGETMLGRNMKLRSLASAEVQQQSDDDLARITGKGKGKMPAYDRKLSKAQIDDVVKYIRSLKK
jgi:mono/diheme cytochrome c family protein